MEPSFISVIWLALITFAGISLLLYAWTRQVLFKYFSLAWFVEGARTIAIDFQLDHHDLRYVTYLAYIPVPWFLLASVTSACRYRIPGRLSLWYFILSTAFVTLNWYGMEPYFISNYGEEVGQKFSRYVLCIGVFVPAGGAYLAASGLLIRLSRRQGSFVPLIAACFFALHGIGTLSLPVNQFYFDFGMPGSDLFWIFQALGMSAGMMLIGAAEIHRGWKEIAQTLKTLDYVGKGHGSGSFMSVAIRPTSCISISTPTTEPISFRNLLVPRN